MNGGAFLLETATPEQIFTPEDFTEENIGRLRKPRRRSGIRKSRRIWRRSSIRISMY